MLNLENITPTDKNNYLLFGIIGAIIIVLSVAAYFIFSNGDGSEDDSLISSKSSTLLKRINIKEIDITLFSDFRFVNLKDLKIDEPGLNELNIGQKNPFTPAQ